MECDLANYELQLSQVQLEISHCSDEDKKTTLIQLESDIKELITLTRASQIQEQEPTNHLDDEYNLFRAELALDEDYDETIPKEQEEDISNAVDDLQNDLASLPGMKCQAPFTHPWSDEPVFHNALVFKVEKSDEVLSAEDISLRVMFTNPTHIDMKPCPYFLEGECRFPKEKCRFSHGEIVPLVSLKEYKEPNFSDLECGSRVLVKQEDGLWCSARIQSVDLSQEQCSVKLESNGREEHTDLHNVFPLDGNSEPLEENISSSDDGDDDRNEPDALDIMRNLPTATVMGGWEQFTKGFGSRIMERMGYVHGAGLGAKADGRIEPVPAVVYPAGKSLDHCMMLKEKAGGDQDLFKADRKVRRMQKRHEDAMSRAYEKEKQRTDVFSFLNDRIGHSEKLSQASTPNGPTSGSHKQLHTATQKGLNVSSLQIAEDVRKTEKERKKLSESLTRHSAASPTYAAIKEKIRECDGRLTALEASDRKISTELQQRSDRKKLSIF